MNNTVRILVVDDDPDILYGTARLLEKAGYAVDRASSGEEALQAVQKHLPDLLLLDSNLPGINGIEVCRRIKRDPAMADSLVVIVSGSYTESDEQVEGLDSGADGYIVRPIANRELLARVRSFVRIVRLTSSLRLNAEELKKSNEAVRQAYLASLNLAEDAAVARDRAEQASRALKESEEKLRSIFASMTEMVVLHELVCDEDGRPVNYRILDCNPAFTRIAGIRREDAVGRLATDVYGADTAPYLDEYARVALTGEPCFFIDAYAPMDKHFDIRVASPGKNMFVTVTTDITERKQAEENLRFQAHIIDNSPVIAAYHDKDLNVVWVNRAYQKATGLSLEEVRGRKCYQVWNLSKPCRGCPVIKAIETGESAASELTPGNQDHWPETQGYWLSQAAPVRDKQGAVIGAIEFAIDITERKQAEAERREMERKLQQTQKLESLGVLAGGIAHDFNNILMVILGNTELALREMGPLSPARESMTEISAASRQAAELCKQMLAYAGRASFVWEPLDLAILIKETAHLIKVSTSRGVVLKYELEPGLVEGDPSQLRQVVMNLVINSSESIGERSGVVTIATGKVFLDEAEARRRDPSGGLKAGEYVCLRVADNGRGMDEATRSRVFEPFFTTKFTGRGLGLAAVLGIVQGHGGTISAESEPEVGTTFQVLLPALGAEQSARPPAAGKVEAPGWTGTGTVLVAEDEDRVRTLTARILEGMGFTVLTSADGREAVEVYREHGKEIDLVILDLTMPHLDGAGALEKILEIDPEARIIIASGFSEEELERRFRQSALAGILQKPYDLESFAAAVRRALTK